jgi:glucose/arabinose dehydrogenase
VGADEIWAFGLRNPWRASFDRGTGDLYIADVGQGSREEVNVSTAASGGGNGVNYGWKIMEGTSCFSPPCNVPGLTPPVLDYDSGPGPACSITGGYVYRGTVIPALQGTYFYGDYCAGFVRSFRFANGVATEQSNWPALDLSENITSFGEDKAGELHIVTQQGAVYRIIQN